MDLDRLLKHWNTGRRDLETCGRILSLLEEEVGIRPDDYSDLSGAKDCFARVDSLHRRDLCSDAEASWRFVLLSRFLGHAGRHDDRIQYLEWLLGISEEDYDDEETLRVYLNELGEMWLKDSRLELVCHLAESQRVFGRLNEWVQLLLAAGGLGLEDFDGEESDDVLFQRLWTTTREVDFDQAFQFLMEWADALRFRGRYSEAARLVVAFFGLNSEDFEDEATLEAQVRQAHQELGRDADFIVREWADALKMLGRWDDAAALVQCFAETRPEDDIGGDSEPELSSDLDSVLDFDLDSPTGFDWEAGLDDDETDSDDDFEPKSEFDADFELELLLETGSSLELDIPFPDDDHSSSQLAGGSADSDWNRDCDPTNQDEDDWRRPRN